MKSILCFGDSNTWGWNLELYNSETGGCGRFGLDIRWTGRLQKLLGEDFRVLEDGVNGRVSVFDDPFNPARNGLDGLRYALERAAPLELVVIMLGTNDVKSEFNASAGVIAKGIGMLCAMVNANCKNVAGHNPRILVIAPLPLNEGVENGMHADNFDAGSAAKSRELAGKYEIIARRNGAFFLDAAAIGLPCDADGVHLTAEGHARLAGLVAGKIKEIL